MGTLGGEVEGGTLGRGGADVKGKEEEDREVERAGEVDLRFVKDAAW